MCARSINEKEKLLCGIENGSILPKSQALILAFMLYYNRESCPVNHIYSFLKELDDFYPLQLFTGCIDDDNTKIHDDIFCYISSDDSDLADLYNQIVMLIYYHRECLEREEWYTYFDGYRNQNISDEMRFVILERTINDICDLLEAPHLKIVKYEYGVDEMFSRTTDPLLFNPELRKIYLVDCLGGSGYHNESLALGVVIDAISKYLLYLCKDDEMLMETMELNTETLKECDNEFAEYIKVFKIVSNQLRLYYDIYSGEI